MRTLNELAGKLQDFIIKQQQNAHDSVSLNVSKYNNLKLKMQSSLNFPNIVVCIGISEAVFNFKDQIKIDGGLGPDEKYVRKWLGNSATIQNLTEIYKHITDLVTAEEELVTKKITEVGEADEVKREAQHQTQSAKNRLQSLRDEIGESQDENDLVKRNLFDENPEMAEYNYDESIMNDYDPTNPAGLESVEIIKKDLKNILGPRKRKFEDEHEENNSSDDSDYSN